MTKNFEEIKKRVKSLARKKIAIAVAEDEEVLAAIRQAQDEGFGEGILTGDEGLIREVANKNKISLDGFQIIHEPDHLKATEKCCELIRKGEASVIMKGLLDTSKFLKGILNKEKGLNKGKLLSHVAAMELATYPKLLFVTDAAINIAPDLSQKVQILQNSVDVAHMLGIEKPLVACCTAIEKINPTDMPATVDAACLAKMSERGQLRGCVVDGPLAIDNAVSEESARIKKIGGPVAGKADILFCNDIESANYLYKTLIFLAGAKVGAIVAGAAAPIVLTSRSDSHLNKYLSIVLALVSSKI